LPRTFKETAGQRGPEEKAVNGKKNLKENRQGEASGTDLMEKMRPLRTMLFNFEEPREGVVGFVRHKR